MAAVSFEAIKKVYPDGTLAIPGLDLDVVDAISAVERDGRDRPVTPVTIDRIELLSE